MRHMKWEETEVLGENTTSGGFEPILHVKHSLR